MKQARRDLFGQSIMLSFVGPDATAEVLQALTDVRPCGVCLFGPNITTPSALHHLTSALQAHARSIGLPPLLIAIDQEGGTVSRLPAPFVTVPSQMAQAATGDSETAAEGARITARQLRAFGINTNFAPVLDVNNNPLNPVIGIRSFGSDPASVGEYGIAALRGFREAGVIATAKHFPGHGDTAIDSHLGLPVVEHDRTRLDEIELAPFRAAIAAGVPAIMTAHIIFRALDDVPATLSPVILNDLLRGELGFEGVVFSDALNMRAVAATQGVEEASIRAKAAGVDVLLPLGSLPDQIALVDALDATIDTGRLNQAMFAATAQRLDQLRQRFAITYDLPALVPLDPYFDQAARSIAQRSITILHGADRLPLPTTTRLGLIDCMLPRFSDAEEALDRAELLRDLVSAAFSLATSLVLGPMPSIDDIAEAVALAGDRDMVLLVTRNASMIGEQAELARVLISGDVPVIHAAVRAPYDATVVPGAVASLATYGDAVVSLNALVDVLAGRIEATGVLPVALPTPVVES